MADQAITKKYFQLTFIGCQVGEFDAAAGGCVSELRNRTQMEKSFINQMDSESLSIKSASNKWRLKLSQSDSHLKRTVAVSGTR